MGSTPQCQVPELCAALTILGEAGRFASITDCTKQGTSPHSRKRMGSPSENVLSRSENSSWSSAQHTAAKESLDRGLQRRGSMRQRRRDGE
jgi:hypothetical protein